MTSYSMMRRQRLQALEEAWRAGKRQGPGRVGGQAFIEQWLVCARHGEPGDWEALGRASLIMAEELACLRALGRAYGLGEAWESIERGDFLELVSPMFSSFERSRPSPLLSWSSRWYWRQLPEPTSWSWYLQRSRRWPEEDALPEGKEVVRVLLAHEETDRGVVHTWRDLLAKCTRVHLAKSHDILYEGAGFYHATAAHLSRVNRLLHRAARPSIDLLGRFVDPWCVGIEREVLEAEFGYPGRDAA